MSFSSGTRLPAGTPPVIRRLLERCLVKDRKQRLSDMSVVRFLLNEPAVESGAPGAAAAPSVRARSIGLPLAAAMVAMAMPATAGAMRLLPSDAAPVRTAGVSQLTIALPDGDEVALTNLLIVADDVSDPRGGAWGTDDHIYFAATATSGILRVPASGGKAAQLTAPDRSRGEISHRWPHVLPDRQRLLFTIWTGPGADERQIVVQSIATGQRHVLVTGGDTPRYVNGHLVYARLDNLFAVAWRPSQTSLDGVVPSPLPEHARQENEGAAVYAVSENGTLAYLPGGAPRYAHRVVWVDRAGNAEILSVPERNYESVALSPDGRQAMLQIMEGSAGL